MANREIHNMVMKVVKSKIATAQTEYDDECKDLDQKLKQKKEALAIEKAESIIGKIG